MTIPPFQAGKPAESYRHLVKGNLLQIETVSDPGLRIYVSTTNHAGSGSRRTDDAGFSLMQIETAKAEIMYECRT